MEKDKLLIILWAIIGTNLVLFFAFAGLLCFSFEYAYIESWRLLFQLFLYCNIPTALATVYMLLYMAWIRRLKRWIKIISVISLMILIVFSSLFSFRSMLFMPFVSPFASKTENIDNYLKFDSYVEDFTSHDIFPKNIPESAENIQYFYRYRDIIEEDFDIYLKVRLSESDFEAEKMRIMQQYPNVEVVEDEKGVVDYRIRFEQQGSYYYEFVSFSYKDFTVEYISSYSLEGDSVGDIPYFEEVRKNN